MGNRQALLEAAVQCLQTSGYSRTTARDLVRASGTNLGAIGYHYGSKEALLNEALAVCFRGWVEQLGAQATRRLDEHPADVAEAVLGAVYEVIDADRVVMLAFFEALAQAGRSEELRGQLAGHYREFRTDVAEVVDSITHADDPEINTTLASMIMAVIDGLAIQYLLDPDTSPPPASITGVGRLIAGSAVSRTA